MLPYQQEWGGGCFAHRLNNFIEEIVILLLVPVKMFSFYPCNLKSISLSCRRLKDRASIALI